MAISFINSSTGTTNGTTSTSCTCPASLQANDFLLLHSATKYVAPQTPSGWNLLLAVSGGSGSAGADAGAVWSVLYYKLAVGTELPTQSQSLTVTGGNSATCRMMAFRSSVGAQYERAITYGVDNTPGTGWTITTMGTIETAPNDFFIAASAMNTDTPNYTVYTFSQTSITFGSRTQRYSVGTTSGDDIKVQAATCSVSSGSATGTVTYTQTASSSSANSPAGATIMLRLREKARRVFVN
jgi:hypothetical protein